MSTLDIHYGNNLDILKSLPDEYVDLFYIDPPFNTGKVQSRKQLKTVRDENGDRTGFQGKRYKSICIDAKAYDDTFDDFLAFLEPRLKETYRILKPSGSLFFHIDYRESHYCKIMLDTIFGRESFMNEIIWAYDYGARAKKKWPAKHDTIFWYAKDPKSYTFNYDQMDRMPYMAPNLVTPEKAAIGKTPTDVWWNTIVSPNGKEKTGYPTQKPRAIIDRIIKIHSNPDDMVCDFFAGSGTLGESAAHFERNAILVDINPQSIEVMKKRFQNHKPKWHGLESL